jgi:hypothetical protein
LLQDRATLDNQLTGGGVVRAVSFLPFLVGDLSMTSPHSLFFPLARRGFAGLLGVGALALLTACGGGGDDHDDRDGPPPNISLETSVNVAQRGQPLRLIASATAANGVDHVNFYRIDFGSPVLLGRVSSPPPNWDTSVPVNAGANVRFFAEVCDQVGLCTDSNIVTVAVYP